MLMEKLGIASIIISLIAALGGWAAARESRKATTTNTVTSGRVEMEKEAYERARALDTETIRRQEEKIDKLEEEAEEADRDIQQLHYANDQLRQQNERLVADNRRIREALTELQVRVTRMQRG